MYKKLASLGLSIAAFMMLVGCSKEPQKVEQPPNSEVVQEEIVKEEVVVKKGEKLEKDLNGKYVHISDDLNDSGSIYYFRENELILLYGFHLETYNIENKILNDNITYDLSTIDFYEPDSILNYTLTISENNDKTINMNWVVPGGESFIDADLKLLTAKECVESVLSSNPSYIHDRDWEEFGLTYELFYQVSNEMSLNEVSDEVSNEITEEKALELCKEKVGSDYLTLGSDEYGMDKIVDINGDKYYGIYYVNDGIVGDYRYCVSISTGEVFFQDVVNLESLTPIDEYLQN